MSDRIVAGYIVRRALEETRAFTEESAHWAASI